MVQKRLEQETLDDIFSVQFMRDESMNEIYYAILFNSFWIIFFIIFIYNIARYFIKMKKPFKAGKQVYTLTGKISNPRYDIYLMFAIVIISLVLIVVNYKSCIKNSNDLFRTITLITMMLNWPIAANKQFVILENGLAIKSINVTLDLYEWPQITEFKIYNNQHRDYEYNLIVKYGEHKKRQHKLKLKIYEEERKAIKEIIEKYCKTDNNGIV